MFKPGDRFLMEISRAWGIALMIPFASSFMNLKKLVTFNCDFADFVVVSFYGLFFLAGAEFLKYSYNMSYKGDLNGK